MNKLLLTFCGLGLATAWGPACAQTPVLTLAEARQAAASPSLPSPVLGRLQETAVSDHEDLLGAEDLLEISVAGVEDLSRTVRVSDSGHITLPLIGAVQVAGLSPAALENSLAHRLEARYVNNPQVSVFVKEYGSKMVSIIGAVHKPGRYPMLGRRTLLDMISSAGGLTDEAGPFALITRHGVSHTTEPETIQVDLEALLYRHQTDLNTEIDPGDLVHIPVDLPVRIYVNGAVGKPGEYETTASKPLTLLQAITKAGGLTARAARKKVEILRQTDDGQATISVDLKKVMHGQATDPVLADGDVVVVRETYF
ncbi:MAG: polysaccharide biosynthesis/export family protein [Acidobacteriota bacterium]